MTTKSTDLNLPRVWTELRRLAESRWPEVIYTSLLGWIQFKLKNGSVESVIPDWVVQDATAAGLEVVAANYANNQYTLKLSKPPETSQGAHMDETTFKRMMNRARLLKSEYGAGYITGLRRHYHGENFNTQEQHALCMTMGMNGDTRVEYGRGYRDGYAGNEPDPTIGRPTLPDAEKTQPRSIRLNDARWEKLQELGREWLEQRIDEA